MPTTASPDPWIRKKAMKKPSFNIGSIMRTKTVEGDIGIEVEVEGNKFPKDSNSPEYIPAVWKWVKDGSLRGQDNAEYVLRSPLKFEQVPTAISDLWAMFDKYGSKLDESNRTSVHVHLNAQKWHLNRVCAFAALYFSVEELLTEWCGDHRVGNLFCLRAKDAPGQVSKLKTFIQHEGDAPLTDGLHYSGLNISALCKFGSIEIRSLRGCTDPQTILDWVSILERIYRLSAEFPDPRQVVEGFSGEGPMAYLDRVLGDKTSLVVNNIGWDNQRIMESMYEGIRLAQDLCYCRDWSEFDPVELAPDPFNRSSKSLAAAIQQQQEALMNHMQDQAAYQAILLNPTPGSIAWPTTMTATPYPATAHDEIYQPEPDGYNEPAHDDDEEDHWWGEPIYDEDDE